MQWRNAAARQSVATSVRGRDLEDTRKGADVDVRSSSNLVMRRYPDQLTAPSSGYSASSSTTADAIVHLVIASLKAAE
jgi:hypothetical protein